jgi:hypothetical protein
MRRCNLFDLIKGMGDCDTTCAIMGGIVSLSAKEIPETWLERREPLPDLWYAYPTDH